ncbi:hypothetical protein Tco_0341044 [Tanacetum coccineum]
MKQPMPNPEDITDPTAVMNMELVVMAKAFKLNHSTPTNNNQRISSNPRNRQYAGQNVRNQVVQNAVQNPAARAEGNANGNNEAGIQLQAEEFDLIAATADLDEIEESNKAPVYDFDSSAEVYDYENCYNNEIFNMFTQEDQYTELLEPILEPHQVQQNYSNVIFTVFSVEQGGGTVEQHPTNVEETRVLYDSLYNNLAIEVEKVNSINRKLRETNADLTTELVRYKNQEKCFEISQENYDKLERCYQQSVYQEQYLTKKINALHLSSGKQITALNEEISNLNKQLSKENYNRHISTQADESLVKHKALEWEIERLLRAVVSQDITSIVQNNSVVDTSNLQTEIERMKERFENYIIKKENEYAKLWNDWYKKCEKCKYDKISYDKAYNDKQQKIERLQAQLGDQKGKCKDTPCVSDTLEPLPQKLKNENEELKFQRKPFLQSLRNTFVVRQPNAFQSERPNLSKTRVPQKVDKTNDLSNPVTSNSVPTTKESKVVDNEKVIAPKMFRINPFKNTREENSMPSKLNKASVRTTPITISQPHVITKKVVNSDSHGFSSTGVDITTKTRRPQPKSNTKNDRVPSAYKSSRIKNKEVEVEEHSRDLLLSKNKKHMSFECNNIKLAIRNDKSEIVCAMYKQCLITAHHDVCVLNYVNGMNSRSKKQKANVSNIVNQTKHKA